MPCLRAASDVRTSPDVTTSDCCGTYGPTCSRCRKSPWSIAAMARRQRSVERSDRTLSCCRHLLRPATGAVMNSAVIPAEDEDEYPFFGDPALSHCIHGRGGAGGQTEVSRHAGQA